ncbi:MAG TPA: BTAD domain-containing putative transcriptional regulator [Oscillospiraceae bacterium]|nr:BTAD domain-containing putative transcriptional regulator [Oscillospiraceae bacterium]
MIDAEKGYDSMQNAENNIQIDMLGEFSIRIGDHVITQDKGRIKQVWILIEYLIANRTKDVSVDKIIEVLWPEDECGDPLNALKNLVYRARKLLTGFLGDNSIEYITFSRNTYAWNSSLPCKIDAEQFETSFKEASNKTLPPNERIQKYLEALSYYKGEFLPKSSSAYWVISANAHYSTIYNECAITVCDLLMDEKRFDEIVAICENALTYSLFEERIHKMLLYAYIATHKYDKALVHYNYVNSLFQKEFGVSVADSFSDIYKKITNSFASTKLDLTAIKNDLNETKHQDGAFYCDYDVFKELYRVQARSVIRTGQPIFLVLFTISPCHGNTAENENSMPALNVLKTSIIGSLRKGDIVSTYSAMQFIVMLPIVDYESAQKVANRIQKAFQIKYQKNDVQIQVKINPIDSGEN